MWAATKIVTSTRKESVWKERHVNLDMKEDNPEYLNVKMEFTVGILDKESAASFREVWVFKTLEQIILKAQSQQKVKPGVNFQKIVQKFQIVPICTRIRIFPNYPK